MKIQELYNDMMSEAGENIFYHGSPYQFDRFDFSKIGTGDGLNKFGYGLYFTNDINTALYYAKELSKGALKENGFNLYTVKLIGLDYYAEWNQETPEEVVQNVMRKLQKMGKIEDVQTMADEYEEYGRYWELYNMYEVLSHILGSRKATSEFLYNCNLCGVIAESPMHKGKIYTAYSDDIKILNIEKLS